MGEKVMSIRYWKKWIAGFLCVALTFSNTLSVGVKVNAAEIETGILDENENPDEENTEETTDDKEDKENEEEVEQEEEEEEAEEPEENTVDTNDTEEKKEGDEENGSENEGDGEQEGTENGGEKEEEVSKGNEDIENDGEIDIDIEEDIMDKLPSDEEEDGIDLTVASNDIASGTYRNILWVIDGGGKLSVTGTGEYTLNSHESAPWKEYSDAIISAEINISGIKYLSNMFDGCSNLINIDFRIDSNKIEYMNSMFYGCSSLSHIDVSGFDTSNVRNMGHMFDGCSSLVELDLSNFDTSNVSTSGMSSMFKGCSSLVELDLSNFNTSKVTGSLRSMFGGCSSLINLNLSNFDTSNVTSMDCMFQDCSSLINLDLSSFKTGSVRDMRFMFDGCISLSNIDLRNFDTGNVTNMYCMFSDCQSLRGLDLSSFDTSKVANMSSMFARCFNLSNLNISSFDTGNVTHMSGMFIGCDSLKTIDLQNFDTNNVESMEGMFQACINLENVNLSSFSIPKVDNMGQMFRWCRNLNSLDLSSFDVGTVTLSFDLIDGCDKLSTIHTPYNLSASVKLPAKSGDIWYRSDGTEVTELPQNLGYSIELGRNYIPEEKGGEIGGDTSGEIEIISNIRVPKDKSALGIIDRATGKGVAGARVWVNSEYWTDENGIVELNNTGLTTIQIEKEGYITKSTTKNLENGKARMIFLIPDTGEVEIVFASLRLTGEDENIMDDTVYLKSRDLEDWEGTAATFVLTMESAGKPKKYQLIQDGKIIQESTTGVFNLPGKYINNSDGSVSCYINDFSAGHRVFARVFDEKNRYKTQELGIRVSEDSATLRLVKEKNNQFEIDYAKHTVTVPDNIPIVGGSELKFGFAKGLPLTVSIDSDSGTVRVAVNRPIKNPDKSDEWKELKKEYKNLENKAIKNYINSSKYANVFGAGLFEVNGDIMGYGEGYLDDASDSLRIEVGIIVSVKGEAKYKHYIVPVYVTVGGGINVTATGEIKLSISPEYNNWVTITGGSAELEPSIYGIVEGGVGVDGIVSLGAYGKFTLSWLWRCTNNYNRVSLNSNIKIKGNALFVRNKVFKELDSTCVIYDSNGRSASYANRMSEAGMDFFDLSGAEVIPMEYLSRRAENSGASTFSTKRVSNSGSTFFMRYAYENASPRLIRAGSKLYLFYLDGVESRNAQNQTALFYQLSKDNGLTWTNAVRVDEKANETADYDFDVAVNGNNIYVIWSDAGKVYGDEILSMDSEKAVATVGKDMDLMLAVINSSTGAIKTSSIETKDADMKPHIAVGNDGTVYIAWITNDVSSTSGLLSNENQMGICYASSAENYAVHSIPLTRGYYPLTLDVGTVGTEICVAVDMDVDGNLNIQEDREIYLVNLKDGGLAPQTANNVVDSVPVFGKIAGNGCLFWYQGGNIAYTSDRQNVSLVFNEENMPPLGQEFSLMEGSNGNASIIWTATSQAEDVGVDMYCTDFDGSGWSNAYMLDKMESEYTAPVSGYLDGADYRMAYLGSTYEGDELYSHIYLCTPPKRTDTSVTLSAEGVGIQGEEYPLHLTVANNGNAPVNSLTISSADGSIQETITGLSIAPGALYDFTWSGITLPSEMSEVYTCKLTVKVPGETDIDGNVFDLTVGEPDFSIDTYLDYSNGDQFAGVIVSNNGILPSDVVLTVYKDENHTSQVYQTTLSGIKGGESKLAIFDLTALDKKSPAFYFAVTDVNGKEIYIGDNEAVLYAGKGTYLEGDSSGDDNDKPTPSPTVEPTAKPTAAPTAKPTAQPATPTPGRPVPSDFPFRDVAVVPGNWKYESIKYVYENGVMNGITNPDGTIDSFQPDESLTRAMFAAVLYRMAGQPPVEFENRFSDVSTGRYYSSAIIWAYKNGIVNGYADGNYGVDDFITREQIAKMLRVYAQVRGYSTNDRADLSRFPDISEVSGWAMEHISWAVGCGMINGKNINGTYYLDAKGNATRAECAAMLMRFINRYGK